MKTTICSSRTDCQPCSLVEFLIGDGVNPGWLDKRVSAGPAPVLADCDQKDHHRQERGVAKWQTWDGDGQDETREISWSFPPSRLDVLECPAPGLENMAL